MFKTFGTTRDEAEYLRVIEQCTAFVRDCRQAGNHEAAANWLDLRRKFVRDLQEKHP